MMVARVALALLLLGCKPQERNVMNTPSKNEVDLDALAKELGVALPPTTRVLGVDRQEGRDDMVRAKLEVPKTDFEEAGNRWPIDLEKLRPGVGRLGVDRGFWNPSQYQELRSASAIVEGARGLHVGVASSGEGPVIVFVINHGT